MDKTETKFENVLHVHIADKASLYAAYMPFLKNGGFFVETSLNLNLGEDAFLLLNLPDEPEKILIGGKIAWITPALAPHGQPRGLGVAFNEKEGLFLRHKIETRLANYTPKQTRTHTL